MRIIQGNALEVLKKIKSEVIDAVVTSPPYWCYSEDTEVLTESGWKSIGEVKINEKVLSTNPETMVLDWVKITAVKNGNIMEK